MKKLILATALFAALGFVLTGCPKPEEPAAPNNSEVPLKPTAPAAAPSPAAAEPSPAAPATLDAATVTAAVKAADPGLADVTVVIDDKGVKLTGKVANNDIKKKAGEAATKAVADAKSDKKVINQLLTK